MSDFAWATKQMEEGHPVALPHMTGCCLFMVGGVMCEWDNGVVNPWTPIKGWVDSTEWNCADEYLDKMAPGTMQPDAPAQPRTAGPAVNSDGSSPDPSECVELPPPNAPGSLGSAVEPEVPPPSKN